MILDTNTYTGLLLKKSGIVALISQASRIGLPLPVIAELKQGFLKGTRLEANTEILERFLARAEVEILLPTISTTEQCARLQFFATQQGRALSNNDIWIAALTIEQDDTLVTYDKDFKVFESLMADKLRVLEA
jgi:tRNA(fMet)-specific endonuclease VapC